MKPTSIRPWVGINMQTATFKKEGLAGKPVSGVVVVNTFFGSPAEAADIRAGDVIVSLNGVGIVDPKEFSAKIKIFSQVW